MMPGKRACRPTINAILSLEERFNDPSLTEEAVTVAETRIKNICGQLYPNDPTYTERFIHLLRNRWRSSGSFVDYIIARNALLANLATISVRCTSTSYRRVGAAFRHSLPAGFPVESGRHCSTDGGLIDPTRELASQCYSTIVLQSYVICGIIAVSM
jgi:hypothetical protein